MVNASTPSTSISRAAVSRIWSAVTPSLLLLRGDVNRLTPGDSLRLRQAQIAFQVAVHVDHAPLLVGQRQMGQPRLVQPALKPGQHRDVLCEYKSGMSVIG